MRFLLAFLLAGAAAAQPPPADTTLPAVSVVATRDAVAPEAAPARVTVLDAEAIRATGSRTVADLIEARAAAFVRRYGPGGLASVSLRGTGASQTLVLLDGHRIADPQLGQLDWSLLPTVLLERVEILHGAGSALHGTDGLGGVVDLRTLRPEGRTAEALATAGAFGERAVSARAADGVGRLRFVAAAEGRAEDNDFPYFDPNAGLNGETLRRSGADRSLASAFARAEADLGRTTAHLAAWGGAAERGIPGSIGAPTDARQEDRHLRLWGGAATRFRWGSLRAGGLVQRASLRYQDDEGRTTIASADLEARVLAGGWLVHAGLSGGLGAAAHPSLAADAREGRLGAYVSASGSLGRVALYPALRADVYRRAEGAERTLAALSPRLGVNAQPVAAWPLRLKAGVGSAFRAPTFNDRFWRYASGLGGDPDLRPERSWTADAGAFLPLGPLRAELTGYVAATRDQIVWLPSPAGPYTPRNLGRTRTLGLEATAEAEALRLGPAALGGGLTAALTDARDYSDPQSAAYGRPLRLVPRWQLKAHTHAALALDARTRLRLDLGARRVGERPVTADGSIREPAYFVADGRLGLSRSLDAATVSLSLGVENVLDADYAVLRGYPMPPRHARLRLGVAL